MKKKLLIATDSFLPKLDGATSFLKEIIPKIHNDFNITIVSMGIHNRDEGWYYADIVLQDKTRVFRIDIKPSDAMALALRANATIYINSTLLEQDGVDICPEE